MTFWKVDFSLLILDYQRLKDSELVIPNETSWMHRTCRCKTKGIENETEKQEYSNKQKPEFPKSIHIK